MRATIFLLFVFSLQACVNVATTGAQAVYNHHSIEKSLKDQYLSMKAYQSLYFDTDEFKDTNIAITTYNDEMLLAGQAPEKWQREKAEQIVRENTGVKTLYNLISLDSPSSTLTRVSDAWITTKVKGKLIASTEIDATQIKVVTENGTVYLMGVLLPEHASIAVDLARNTDGVQSVVKIFSYMKISKHIA